MINGAHSQERIIRSSIRSMLENQLSPDFYPTRGRRAKSSEEEVDEPPFWAQRGRSLDVLSRTWPRNVELSSSNSLEDLPNFWASSGHQSPGNDKEIPFWANRGRSVLPSDCIDPNYSLAYAEEPRVVVIERRDNSDDDHNYSNFWASRGRRDQYGLMKHRLNKAIWKRNTIKLTRGNEKPSKYDERKPLSGDNGDH
ncbi:hypothetical protein M8J76_016836 [Diaphorina citri]|nr:hypothetical protein M8J76_016836 [Diaphorina citri]